MFNNVIENICHNLCSINWELEDTHITLSRFDYAISQLEENQNTLYENLTVNIESITEGLENLNNIPNVIQETIDRLIEEFNLNKEISRKIKKVFEELKVDFKAKSNINQEVINDNISNSITTSESENIPWNLTLAEFTKNYIRKNKRKN
ncbi:Peptidase M20, dimerization domain containing protein [Parasponia andersonii]|uniref:Peptidase M20, dimerization domain containing protein n=1 Tax=Parasponia andersonii TaxID=3476 RepID=A0A2P5BPQ2_PARAD|nr:Peptidase M20, dimerization domain containing protein [Parasponia andersonii]